MILNFIFSNLNAIILGIWVLFLMIVAIRVFKPSWVKNISYTKILFITVGLLIFYSLFVTWGQYYVWLKSSDMTRMLLNLSLPEQVPFPKFLEWARFLFKGSHGYFVFYVFGRIWLNIFISFFVSGFLYLIFKTWNHYKGSFSEKGPELLLVLMLISGFPGILVTIPLGFVLSIIAFAVSFTKGIKEIKIEPYFVFATLISLLFTNIILSYVL